VLRAQFIVLVCAIPVAECCHVILRARPVKLVE
jgi:hypothetical protein